MKDTFKELREQLENLGYKVAEIRHAENVPFDIYDEGTWWQSTGFECHLQGDDPFWNPEYLFWGIFTNNQGELALKN